MLANPVVASSAAILGGFHWIISFGLSGPALGATLIVGAILAYIGLLLGHRISNVASLALLMPQFALLVGAFLSDAESVYTGMLPDGREVDKLLLFTVLCPIMFTSILHTFAIIERHSKWTRT